MKYEQLRRVIIVLEQTWTDLNFSFKCYKGWLLSGFYF